MNPSLTSAENRFRLVLPRSRISGALALAADTRQAVPLIVCVHGGGYTHRYFDIPSASLLDAGNAARFNVFSIDRPDYGNTGPLPKGRELIRRNGDAVCEAVDELIARHLPGTRQVVFIGHSIGGAVCICAAARQPQWLMGVAVSGVGFKADFGSTIMMKLLPPLRRIAMPDSITRGKLFGPPGSCDQALIARQMELSLTSAVRQELKEIYGWWVPNLPAIARQVKTPIDLALGEFDRLWQATPEALQAFGNLFTNSPRVATDIIAGSGHCIDHHYPGPGFHERQLAFALVCCAQMQGN